MPRYDIVEYNHNQQNDVGQSKPRSKLVLFFIVLIVSLIFLTFGFGIGVLLKDGLLEAFGTNPIAYNELESPQNLNIDENNYLTWSQVENATKYTVNINNSKQIDTDANEFFLQQDMFIIGTSNNVTVRAIGDGVRYISSEPSNTFYIKFTQKLKTPSLSIPTSPGDMLIWESVDSASYYHVVIDGQNVEKKFITPVYMLSELNVGRHTIEVSACNDSEYYQNSDVASINYTVLKPSAIKLKSPSGLIISASALTWNKVENASGYVVERAGQILSTIGQNDSMSFSLSSFTTPGVYSFSVKALGDGVVYQDSDRVYIDYHVFENSVDKLDSPKITINGSIVSWEKVDNAIAYDIYANGVSLGSGIPIVGDINTTQFDIKNIPLLNQAGSYVITMRAIGDGIYYSDSDLSNQVSYSVDSNLTKLNIPNISINNDSISWQKISNAIGYSLAINGIVQNNYITSTAISYTLSSDMFSQSGTYKITLKALGDHITYQDSDFSNEVEYSVTITKAPTPTDINVENGYVVFKESNTNVSKFRIKYGINYQDYDIWDKNAKIIEVSASGEFNIALEPNGTYGIAVQAVGGSNENGTWEDSDWSAKQIFTLSTYSMKLNSNIEFITTKDNKIYL